MRTAFLIAGKDLKQRLRDRSAMLVAVVVPLALAGIFAAVIGDTNRRVTFPFAVADLDNGAVARTFTTDVLGRLAEQGVVHLDTVASEAAGRARVRDRQAAATFVIPSGFTAAVNAGRPATIVVIGDRGSPIGTLVARSIASAFTSDATAVRVAVAAAIRAGDRSPVATLAATAAALPAQVLVADTSASRRDLDAKTFYAAGMAVFFLFFTVQFGVSSLLDERRDGTLLRLLAAPVSRTAILLGKTLTSLALGVASMGVLIVATGILLGARWGSPIGVALLVIAGVAAATSVMALVATIARTADQAQYLQSIVAFVLGLLGGAFFPVGRSGGILAAASLVTPHAWFLRGLANLTGGQPWTAALPAAGVMLAFAVVTGSVALLRADRLVAP